MVISQEEEENRPADAPGGLKTSGLARGRFHPGHERFEFSQHLLRLIHVLLDDFHNRGTGNCPGSLRINCRSDLIGEEIPKPCRGGAAWYSASFSTR